MTEKTVVSVTDPQAGSMHYKESYFFAKDSFDGSLSDQEFSEKIKSEDIEVDGLVFSSKQTSAA